MFLFGDIALIMGLLCFCELVRPANSEDSIHLKQCDAFSIFRICKCHKTSIITSSSKRALDISRHLEFLAEAMTSVTSLCYFLLL